MVYFQVVHVIPSRPGRCRTCPVSCTFPCKASCETSPSRPPSCCFPVPSVSVWQDAFSGCLPGHMPLSSSCPAAFLSHACLHVHLFRYSPMALPYAFQRDFVVPALRCVLMQPGHADIFDVKIADCIPYLCVRVWVLPAGLPCTRPCRTRIQFPVFPIYHVAIVHGYRIMVVFCGKRGIFPPCQA